MAQHRCPAVDCAEVLDGSRFMCPAHWRRLHPRTRRRLVAAYRPGQGAGDPPSVEWCRAADAAVASLAAKDGKAVGQTFLAAFHPGDAGKPAAAEPAKGRHDDLTHQPTGVPGAERTGAVYRGAPCFHEVAVGIFQKQPDLLEWCRLCGAYRVYGEAKWVAPWLVSACVIAARGKPGKREGEA
jgi:hypothetical protein